MNARLIDVREYPEYAGGHLEGSELVPLGSLDKVSDAWERTAPLTLVCRSGRRAEEARQVLVKKGFTALTVLQGDVQAWVKRGGPLMVSAVRPWSMERQVRIAAGSLVLLFLSLSFLISKTFVVGAALIGAGLAYSGISDTCTMAYVLGRMPWNHPRRWKA